MTALQDRSNYPITVDSVIFGYAEGALQVALIERERDPFKGMWAIPGGFMEGDETVEETAHRELKEETGLESIYLEQFHVCSSHGRDPRGRTITVAFFALIDSDKYHMVASQDALQAKWWPAYKLPPLAFHQDEIYQKALQALRIAVKTRPIAFELLPKFFTLTQLQILFEQLFGIAIDKRNFRRKVAKMEFIVATDKKQEGEKHRPATLYYYDQKRYKEFYNI
ncbi:MAG: NUDIX hydrolase [Verrucomicrobia bacterium]|nr:NUDIX hydrolase [Verrucomicrobiota bacterium]